MEKEMNGKEFAGKTVSPKVNEVMYG
jgi:hypothetical protein